MRKTNTPKTNKSSKTLLSNLNRTEIVSFQESKSCSDAATEAYHYSCGLTFLEYGKFKLAINEFTSALQEGSTPTSIPTSPFSDLKLNCLIQRAQAYFQLFDYKKAISDCSAVLLISPNNTQIKELLNKATTLQNSIILESQSKSIPAAQSSVLQHEPIIEDIQQESNESKVMDVTVQCTRCKEHIAIDSSFCTMCGLANKLKRRNPSTFLTESAPSASQALNKSTANKHAKGDKTDNKSSNQLKQHFELAISDYSASLSTVLESTTPTHSSRHNDLRVGEGKKNKKQRISKNVSRTHSVDVLSTSKSMILPNIQDKPHSVSDTNMSVLSSQDDSGVMLQSEQRVHHSMSDINQESTVSEFKSSKISPNKQIQYDHNSDDERTELTLTTQFVQQLNATLSTPIVSESEYYELQHKIQRVETIEVKNAMDIENAYQKLQQLNNTSDHVQSTTSTFNMSNSNVVNASNVSTIELNTLKYSTSSITLPVIKNTRKQSKATQITKKLARNVAVNINNKYTVTDNYLDNVESIKVHYNNYMERLEEYKNIHSIVRDTLLPLNSDVNQHGMRRLNEMEIEYGESEFQDIIRPVSKQIVKTKVIVDVINYTDRERIEQQLMSQYDLLLKYANSVVTNDNEIDISTVQPQGVFNGNAFLWGPLFDTSQNNTLYDAHTYCNIIDTETIQYSKHGDYVVSLKDSPKRTVLSPTKHEMKLHFQDTQEVNSEDIFYWGDTIQKNLPPPVTDTTDPYDDLTEEQILQKLLNYYVEGIDEVPVVIDTESESSEEEDFSMLEIKDIAFHETITQQLKRAQEAQNNLNTTQLTLHDKLPTLHEVLNSESIVETLEKQHAVERKKYLNDDENFLMRLQQEQENITKMREIIAENRHLKMLKFEKQLEKELRHERRHQRKLQTKQLNDTIRQKTASPIALQTNEDVKDQQDEDRSGLNDNVSYGRKPLPAANSFSKHELYVESEETKGGDQNQADSDSAVPSTELELVDSHTIRMQNKLNVMIDDQLLMRIDNTLQHNRDALDVLDNTVTLHSKVEELNEIQADRELSEMQRRVEMLHIEKLLDQDRLLAEVAVIEQIETQEAIQEQSHQYTKNTLIPMANKSNHNDHEDNILTLDITQAKDRIIDEDLDFQKTITNKQIEYINNMRERDINELKRKIIAIRAEKELKMEIYNSIHNPPVIEKEHLILTQTSRDSSSDNKNIVDTNDGEGGVKDSSRKHRHRKHKYVAFDPDATEEVYMDKAKQHENDANATVEDGDITTTANNSRPQSAASERRRGRRRSSVKGGVEKIRRGSLRMSKDVGSSGSILESQLSNSSFIQSADETRENTAQNSAENSEDEGTALYYSDDSEIEEGMLTNRSNVSSSSSESEREEAVMVDEKPVLYLDQTTDIAIIEQLQTTLFEERSQHEMDDIAVIQNMQRNVNSYEHYREVIGTKRTETGKYFDIGEMGIEITADNTIRDVNNNIVDSNDTKQLTAALQNMSIIHNAETIELIDKQLVSAKDIYESVDTNHINYTLDMYSVQQTKRDDNEKNKSHLLDIENGVVDVDADSVTLQPPPDEVQVEEDVVHRVLPLSMIRDANEIEVRENLQTLQRNEEECIDEVNISTTLTSIQQYNINRDEIEKMRRDVLQDIDTGVLLPSIVQEQNLTENKKIYTVDELILMYGENGERILSNIERDDFIQQNKLRNLNMNDDNQEIDSIEYLHNKHRVISEYQDTQHLFIQQSELLARLKHVDTIEEVRRLDALQHEDSVYVAKGTLYTGTDIRNYNKDVSTLHISRDYEKLQTLERTQVFRKAQHEASDAFQLEDNQDTLEELQQQRESVTLNRQLQLEVIEKEQLLVAKHVEDTIARSERIRNKVHRHKHHKPEILVDYSNQVQDANILAEENLEFVLETNIKNVLTSDQLTQIGKIEHAETIQRTKQQIQDSIAVQTMQTNTAKELNIRDELAVKRLLQVEDLYDDAGIELELEDEVEPSVTLDNPDNVAEAEEKVEEVQAPIEKLKSRRQQRREEALANLVIPDKITVSVQDTSQLEGVAIPKHVYIEPSEEAEYRTERLTVSADVSNLMAIKRFYNDSYKKLKAVLNDLQIDLKLNPQTIVDIDTLIRKTQNKLINAYDVLEEASKINSYVNIEYSMFLDYLSSKRTHATLELSDALAEATECERTYRDKYNQAAHEFHNKEAANEFKFVSATGKHITTSKQMDKIKAQAEREMAVRGDRIKSLQSTEAAIILEVKQEEFVVQEIIKHWHPRHTDMINQTALAYKRLEGWMKNNIAVMSSR